MLPAMHSEVFRTENGTNYLKSPGVVLIGHTVCDLEGVRPFLEGLDDGAEEEDLRFEEYLDDPVKIPDAEQLIKFAGQLCYLSLGPKRTWNIESEKYLDNIKTSGHGSVTEHAQFSFLVYGIDRAVTHELVRHRSGMAYSQVSQRYVDGKTLRFVERYEYQNDEVLHTRFEKWIDTCVDEYDFRATVLRARQQAGAVELTGEKARDLRKKVNQAARSCLPNETEAPIVVSANARALRHVIEMRAASPADVAIRAMAYKLYQCVVALAPDLFSDYTRVELPDGVPGLSTPNRKI